MKPQQIDVFCEVVDNYGDIGVCWRLAQQLQHRVELRLFVDDLVAFQHIEPTVNPNATVQQVQNTTVIAWSAAGHYLPAPVVIEAFGCDLPSHYSSQMVDQTKLWINLEYLSAESWIESVHALPSPQANGVVKYFFFPGFTTKTGGLLRPTNPAPALLDTAFWQSLDLAQAPHTDKVAFVFPYANAPLDLLYQILAAQPQSWSVLLAATAPAPSVRHQQTLPIYRLPFIAQAQFDALLDYADLNVVRGEDSFVRAIWAQKPFIWQPYLQDGAAHLLKLQAWLEQTPFDAATQQLIYQWNSDTLSAFSLDQALQQLPHWEQQCSQYAQSLGQQTDLATQLLAFCSQTSQKTVK